MPVSRDKDKTVENTELVFYKSLQLRHRQVDQVPLAVRSNYHTLFLAFSIGVQNLNSLHNESDGNKIGVGNILSPAVTLLLYPVVKY